MIYLNKEKTLGYEYLYPQLYCKSLYSNHDCEDFLLELVNLSKLKEKYHNKDFHSIQKQSNGEPDIENGYYTCDFKIVAAEKYMKEVSYFCDKIIEMDDGIITVSSNHVGTANVPDLFRLIQNATLLDFDNENKKALKNFSKNLQKNKNLFLFLPLVFENNNKLNEELKSKEVENLIFKVFKKCKVFRSMKSIEHGDLFICYLYNKKFYILQIYENKYELLDMVNVMNVPTFVERYWNIEF